MPESESKILEWVRGRKALAMGLVGVTILLVVVALTPPRRASSRLEPLPPELRRAEPVGWMLADVRGEDVIERLRTGQAAIRQEMNWVRHVLASGEGVSITETDLLQAVAELQAENAELKGLVRILEVGQMRVESMAIRYESGLEALSERLDGFDLAGEGN